jgi:hypothetical protein
VPFGFDFKTVLTPVAFVMEALTLPQYPLLVVQISGTQMYFAFYGRLTGCFDVRTMSHILINERIVPLWTRVWLCHGTNTGETAVHRLETGNVDADGARRLTLSIRLSVQRKSEARLYNVLEPMKLYDLSLSAGVFYQRRNNRWASTHHRPLNNVNDGTAFQRAVQCAKAWRENYHKVSLATHRIQNNWFDALRLHPERMGFLRVQSFDDLRDRQRAEKPPEHWTKTFDKVDIVMYQLLRVIDL